MLCNDGTFEQILELLLRVYSTTRGDGTISRSEIAAILEKHVVYEYSEVRLTSPTTTRDE